MHLQQTYLKQIVAKGEITNSPIFKMILKLLKSFSAKGNIELFANNTDSGESARNELSHLK